MTTAELITAAKKNPIITVCGVLSVALAVGIYFRSDAISDANAELDAKSAEARRYELNIANANQLKEQYDALVAANASIEDRLIRATEIGINQQYFYKLESDTGVKLSELNQNFRSAKATPAAGRFVPVLFNVSASGNFAQIMTFLRGLENGSHLCRVVSASCAAGRTGPVGISLGVELLGRP